jgi:hypothetical protein
LLPLAAGINLGDAVGNVIASDLVASAVRDLMEGKTQWEGTASRLLWDLATHVGENAKIRIRSRPDTSPGRQKQSAYS